MSRDAIFARIAEHPRLPSPPEVSLKVLEKASKPDCTMAEIAVIISHDPALCANIIKLVNSALYTMPRAVTSIDRALQMLGLKRVRSLVLSLALPAMQHKRNGNAHLQNFWKASVAGAVVARELSIHLKRPDPEADMVTGLLRDIGVLALHETFPEKAAQLVAFGPQDMVLRQCETETDVWGVHHAEVGAFILQRWRLPRDFTEPIRFHHHPAHVPPKDAVFAEQAMLLYFANLIAQLQVYPNQPALVEAVVDLGRARFGLVDQRLQEFVEPLKGKIKEIAGILKIEIGECLDYKDLVVQTADTLTRMVVETTVENLVMQEEKKVAEEERRQAEDALRVSEAQARQSQKMEAIGRLAGGIAHDFNNLLTVINGYSALLVEMLPANTPQHGFVEQIKTAGEKAAGLTGQLLAFSRKQVVCPTDVDLNAMVAGLSKMMHRLVGERVAVVHKLEPKLACVRADPSQIDQVLLNLLVNARDAMPQGGTITIETANLEFAAADKKLSGTMKPGKYVGLIVADTGCGMDDNTKQHMFEPFFSTKEKGHGTGLGLATVHSIVKQAGGHVSVESKLGKGTTFTICLPRAGDTVAPVKVKTLSTLSGNETILLAEDDDAVRAVVRQTLQAVGYKVLEAAHGEAALAVAQSFSGIIDLLLTDVVMPKLDGCELVKRLGKLRPKMKVCYMSGYVDDNVLRSGIADSGLPFLAKPFSPHALACRVREALTVSKPV